MLQRKITATAKFKVDPDLAIREYELPAGKNETRPVVDKSGLALKIKRDPKTGIVRKDYYFAKGGDIKEKLGDAHKLTFRQALAMVSKIKKRDYIPQEKVSKASLEAIFLAYVADNRANWKPTTLAKKEKLWKYLMPLAKKTFEKLNMRSFALFLRNFLTLKSTLF